MEITWHQLELLDADGGMTAAGEAALRGELRREHLAIITVLGARATQTARRQLVAQLWPSTATTALDASVTDGVALLASIVWMDEDLSVLVLDVGSSASPVVGALCALSSVVLSSCDTDAALACALPAFPPFQELIQRMKKDTSLIELFELVPSMLTIDFSSSGHLQMPRNVASRDDFTQLKTMGIRTPEFLESLGGARFLRDFVKPKKTFGMTMTGEVALHILRSLGRDIRDGQEPDLAVAWDEEVERMCKLVAEDALATYVDCMSGSVRETPPMEQEAFDKLHEELRRLALDVFHSGASFRSASRRNVRTKLKADLDEHYAQGLEVLQANSRAFCEQVRSELWQELSAPVLEGDENASSTFRAALRAIRQFDEVYNERAHGPAKASILRSFHQQEALEIFQRLEGIASRQMTEEHLRDLRERLEAEYESKKAALVEHFQQQQVQLRQGFAQEMETMQKLEQARRVRTNIDESETKRLREDLLAAQAQIATLEQQQVVLEFASDDAIKQKAVLEAKVAELEQAVRQEMGNRAELVDTLSATIRTAEAKERQLQDTIATLRVEVQEKGARVESELADVRQQLKKTTEEKEELQKKLNEFFLRVTALPEPLQHQLFCSDGDAQVGFADALATFMSK